MTWGRLVIELTMACFAGLGAHQLYVAYAHQEIWGGLKYQTHWISLALEPDAFAASTTYWVFHTLFFAAMLVVFVLARLEYFD